MLSVVDAEDAALEHVGQIIADKYRLLNLLGAGGMGAVYEAEHVFTKRRVALKRMHSSIAQSKHAAERFMRESQAPSSIGHPGIVQVLDGGVESDGSLYLVLELLEGVSMREALDEDALRAEDVVQIGVELLEALAAAHERGFIHRDIKPDNIFLAHDGRGGVSVKLLDFGIASARGSETDVKLTQTGAVLGTPLYMSPEQATGVRIDARSDLWSVGALLYRALSGASPFDGDSYNALIVSIVTQEHLPLADRRGDLPAALHAVVEGALQKETDKRFQSAREMLAALRGVRFATSAARQPNLRRVQSQRPVGVDDPAQVSRVQARAPALRQRPVAQHERAAPLAAAPARAAAVVAVPQLTREPDRRLPATLVAALAGGALVVGLFGMFRLGRSAREPVAQAADSRVAALPEPPPLAAAPVAEASATQQVQSAVVARAVPLTAADTGTPLTAARQPRAADGLSVEQVSGVLSAQQPHMQACLQEAVVAQMLAGAAAAPQPLRMAIELHIAPNGRADAVRTQGAVPAQLANCVEARLREAVFPASAAATEFRYPLIFESTIIGR
jgi:serine/threonine-protein kinase